MTFLSFPRLARDAEYLYEKLSFLVESGGWEQFQLAFSKVSRPDLIHDFDTT